MKKNNEIKEKVYKQSPVAICCYVIAAALLVYACYMAGSTVSQIKQYYSGYGMDPSAKEYFTYVLQAMIDPLIRAVLIFMAGYILTAVRKLDPNNYGEKKQAKPAAASAVEAKTKDVKDDIAEAGEKVGFKVETAKKEAAEKIVDVKVATADKIDDVKTSVAEKLDDVKVEASVKTEDIKEDVAEVKAKASTAKKTAGKKTQTAKKKANDKAEEVKEEVKEKTEE